MSDRITRTLEWYEMAYPKACDALDDERAEVRRLRTVLNAVTRERDEARAGVYRQHGDERISLAGTDLGERALVVRWLRSPDRGPGLILSMYADAIERGEHTKEGE